MEHDEGMCQSCHVVPAHEADEEDLCEFCILHRDYEEMEAEDARKQVSAANGYSFYTIQTRY